MDRTREPAIDRSIRQQVRKQEHKERRRERHQQRAEDHLCAELRTQHADTALCQQLEQVSEQHERERNEEQEHERGECCQEDSLLYAARAEKSQIKSLLRDQYKKEKNDSDAKTDDEGLALDWLGVACRHGAEEIIGRLGRRVRQSLRQHRRRMLRSVWVGKTQI